MTPSPADRLIIALDFDNLNDAQKLVQATRPFCSTYKVGLELFTTAGPDALHMLQDEAASFFLDLKLHDIPNTVAGAVKRAQDYGARFLTVHALGGPVMLKAAAEAAPRSLTVLAVSVLTHHTAAELNQMGFAKSPRELVIDWLTPAREAGVRGCICSPEEASAVREAFGKDFTIVCPGIRPSDASLDDQNRVATPAAAIRNGADHLVIGRPITRAANPADAAKRIFEEIQYAS